MRLWENQRPLLERAFAAAVAAADPERILSEHLPEPPAGDIIVVGAGKAAAAMARSVEARYRQTAAWSRLRGRVVTRYGHGERTERIAVEQARHPVPDEAGVTATERILELAEGATTDDLVIVLVSGGGSALLAAPDGVDLATLQVLTRRLLECGASIQEMNMVRKHVSRVKGGRLAVAAAPARVRALVISDVVGDDLASIASGPTVPDPSSFRDALDVLERYDIDLPAVHAHLEAGVRGDVPETPKPNDPRFDRVETRIVASNQQSLHAAARVCAEAGYATAVLASGITGEARVAGEVLAAIVDQVVQHAEPFAPPVAILSGGETTVTVRGTGGRGGRNSECALGFALALREDLVGGGRMAALFADTDGIDGTEDNAGAFVAPPLFLATDRRAAREALEAHDAYGVFEASDLLHRTGPTRTNVNDLRIVLVEEEA